MFDRERSDSSGEPFGPFRSNIAEKYKDQTAALVPLLLQTGEEPTTILPLVYASHSAETLAMHRIVGVNERLINGSTEVQKFVLAHEGLHLQTGDAMMSDAFRGLESYMEFFHKTILPEWMKGDLDLGPDAEYLRDTKMWEDLLYPQSQMSIMNYELAVRGIRNFFQAFARGEISITKFGMMHDSPGRESWAEMLEKPIIDPKEQFETNSRHFARIFVTGLEFADDMFFRNRNQLSRQIGVDALVIEENFANFVAMRKTGVTLEQAKAMTPQDANKFPMVEKFQSLNLTNEEINGIHSQEDIIDIYQKIK